MSTIKANKHSIEDDKFGLNFTFLKTPSEMVSTTKSFLRLIKFIHICLCDLIKAYFTEEINAMETRSFLAINICRTFSCNVMVMNEKPSFRVVSIF